MKKLSLLTLGLSMMSLLCFSQTREFDLQASIDRGKDIYIAQCMSCHMEGGEGIEGIYPPLAKADYLMEDKSRSISTIIHGLTGEIVVNGKTYNMEMTSFDLSDEDVSDVLNYIRNSWGNQGEPVTPEDVEASR
jgi:nitrite reductase (NO-forming)